MNDTELLRYLLHLRERNRKSDFNWCIAAHALLYKGGSYRCDLRLTENLFIARSEPKLLFNEKTKPISKC